MAKVSTITANGVTYDINNGIVKVSGSFSSLPYTLSNSAIKSNMVVLESYFNNPSAVASDIAWTTANGSITLSGTANGTTTFALVLGSVL